MIARLRESLRAIERVVGSEIGKHVIEQITHDVGLALRRIIWEAIAKAGAKRRGPVSIVIDPESMMFMDPKALETEVLHRYAADALPRLRLSTSVAPDDCVTILDVRVPELGVRHAMADIR
jgi:hypothetical protein